MDKKTEHAPALVIFLNLLFKAGINIDDTEEVFSPTGVLTYLNTKLDFPDGTLRAWWDDYRHTPEFDEDKLSRLQENLGGKEIISAADIEELRTALGDEQRAAHQRTQKKRERGEAVGAAALRREPISAEALREPGRIICRYREMRGWKIEDLADAANIFITALSAIEHGERPGVHTMKRLIQVLHIQGMDAKILMDYTTKTGLYSDPVGSVLQWYLRQSGQDYEDIMPLLRHRAIRQYWNRIVTGEIVPTPHEMKILIEALHIHDEDDREFLMVAAEKAMTQALKSGDARRIKRYLDGPDSPSRSI